MLKRLILTLALMLLPAAAYAACPQWQYDASSVIYYSGADLWTPKAHSVVAGGTNDSTPLDRCGIRSLNGPPAPVGYVAPAPDFELQFTANGYQLELRTVGNCDTTLLINTGGGNWYFDDDDNGGSGARIRLTRPSSGVYDIWVGTYDYENCDAQLQLESF